MSAQDAKHWIIYDTRYGSTSGDGANCYCTATDGRDHNEADSPWVSTPPEGSPEPVQAPVTVTLQLFSLFAEPFYVDGGRMMTLGLTRAQFEEMGSPRSLRVTVEPEEST